jgi:hypothetical protein
MLSRHFHKTIFVCASAVLSLTGLSRAALLSPGSAILSTSSIGPLGATLLASNTVPFSTANYSGSLTSQVFIGDTSPNSFGPNDLTFTYQLTNDPTSTDSLERFTISSFIGLLTDVAMTGAGNAFPTSFDRGVTGDVIGESFTPMPLGQGEIDPGMTSRELIIRTNATTFAPTFASVIDSLTANPASFAPIPVPEPTTLALMSLIGIAALRRR